MEFIIDALKNGTIERCQNNDEKKCAIVNTKNKQIEDLETKLKVADMFIAYLIEDAERMSERYVE